MEPLGVEPSAQKDFAIGLIISLAFKYHLPLSKHSIKPFVIRPADPINIQTKALKGVVSALASGRITLNLNHAIKALCSYVLLTVCWLASSIQTQKRALRKHVTLVDEGAKFNEKNPPKITHFLNTLH